MSQYDPTPENVIRELRRIRYNRPPTISHLARLAGLNRTTLYEAAQGQVLTKASALKLVHALQDVGIWPRDNLASLPKGPLVFEPRKPW